MRFAGLLLACAAHALASEQVVLSDDASKLPSLTSILVLERSVSSFSSYLRDSKSLYARILNPLGSSNISIFAPCDQAIMQLARKPHQGPADDTETITVDDEERNAAYLTEWTGSHLVASGVDLDNLPTEAESLTDGRSIKFEAGEAGKTGWEHVLLQPGGAKIISMSQANDGVLYVLDRVLTF